MTLTNGNIRHLNFNAAVSLHSWYWVCEVITGSIFFI